MHLLGYPREGESARQRLEWKLWLAAAAFILGGSLVTWMFLIVHADQAHFSVVTSRPAVHAAPRMNQAASPPVSHRLLPDQRISGETPVQLGTVWVNTASGIYHYPGYRWYGRTVHGKFVSEDEALMEGSRAAANERRPFAFDSAKR